MVIARGIGRLSLLAVGLGIGAAVASTPGIASADDMQISIDGYDLFPTTDNTASAYSGIGDIAIAIGNGSVAEAGAGPDVFGSPVGAGLFDTAFADGTGSLAAAGTGNFDSAFADGAQTISYVGGFNGVLGNHDFGDAMGANAEANAGVFTNIPSSNDVALVFDSAASPLGSTANAGDGNFDLASVFGDNSYAQAGLTGSDDLGAVFGNGLEATHASGGNFLVDIVPDLFGAASSSSADSFSNLLADLMSLL